MGNMSCRDTEMGGVRGHAALLRHITYLCTLGSSHLPGRLLSGWGWGVCAVLRPAGNDAGSATGTIPHWDDPGTGLHSDCSPLTHLKTQKWLHTYVTTEENGYVDMR